MQRLSLTIKGSKPHTAFHMPGVLRWKDKPPRMSGSEGQWGTCGRTCQPTKDSLAHQPHPEKSASSQQKSPQSEHRGTPKHAALLRGVHYPPPEHFLYKRIDICVFITESLYYTLKLIYYYKSTCFNNKKIILILSPTYSQGISIRILSS